MHKTLLYNDGGFDVSQDGLWLCAIAELWKIVSDPALPLASARGAGSVGESTKLASAISATVGARIPSSIAPPAPPPPAAAAIARPDLPSGTISSDEIARSVARRIATGGRYTSEAELVTAQHMLSCVVPGAVGAVSDPGARMPEISAHVAATVAGVRGVPAVGEAQERTNRHKLLGEAGHGVQRSTPGVVESARGTASGVRGDSPLGKGEGMGTVPRYGLGLEIGTESRGSGKKIEGVEGWKNSRESIDTAATGGAASVGDTVEGGEAKDGHDERVFKPWPVRTGLWQPLKDSGALYREGGEANAAVALLSSERGNSSFTSREAGAGTVGTGGMELTPRTPSPRISLKRRLSASWLSGDGSGERKGESSRKRGKRKKASMGWVRKTRFEGGGRRSAEVARPSLPRPPQWYACEEVMGGETMRAGGDGDRSVWGNSTVHPRTVGDGGHCLPPETSARIMSPAAAAAVRAAAAAAASLTSAVASFRSPATGSTSVLAPVGDLRIALPQVAPSGVRSPAPTSSMHPEGGGSEAARRVQQTPRAQQGGDEAARGGLHFLEPPPLFFLQVPKAGARRVDTPWAGGPVRRRRASVFTAATGDGESVGRGETRVIGEALANAATTATAVGGLRRSLEVEARQAGGGRGSSRGGGIDRRAGAGNGGRRIGSDTGERSDETGERRETGGVGRGADRGDVPPNSSSSSSSGTSAPGVENRKGMFVPHLVLVSLHAEGVDGRQAKVVRAAAMDSISAKQVRGVLRRSGGSLVFIFWRCTWFL